MKEQKKKVKEVGAKEFKDPTGFPSLNTKGVNVACNPTQNYKNTTVLQNPFMRTKILDREHFFFSNRLQWKAF